MKYKSVKIKMQQVKVGQNNPILNMSKIKIPTDWQNTKESLRLVLRVIESVRLYDTKPQPNALEYATFVYSKGATTGPLSFGGEVVFDYAKRRIVYNKSGKDIFKISVNKKTQRDIFENLRKRLVKVNKNIYLEGEKIKDTGELDINSGDAKRYAVLQYRMHKALSLFRARLNGLMTQVSLWPEEFDVAFIWFKKGFNEDIDPHMMFGFSPGEKKNSNPYIYLYAKPIVEGMKDLKFPANGSWQKDWHTPGVKFDLEYFVGKSDPEEEVAKVLLDSYLMFLPYLPDTKNA